VDISGLTKVGQTITVGDLAVPEGVTILTSPEDTVVQISYMAEEEELEPVEEMAFVGALVEPEEGAGETADEGLEAEE
jgi:hypothetical protein